MHCTEVFNHIDNLSIKIIVGHVVFNYEFILQESKKKKINLHKYYMKDILEDINEEYNNYCEDLSIIDKELKLMIDLVEGTDYSELLTAIEDIDNNFYIIEESEYEDKNN